MTIKFGASEAIVDFDRNKTLGKLSFLEIKPQYVFEDYVDDETGEIRSRPTDEIQEYDILCNSTVAKGNIEITVPADAKGIDIDEDKSYRKDIDFKDLSARLWSRRDKRMVNNRETTTHISGIKFRAGDFTIVGMNQQPKPEPKKEG